MVGDCVFSGEIKKNEMVVLESKPFLPLGHIVGSVDLFYSFDGEKYFENPCEGQTFRLLKIIGKEDCHYEIYEGEGFIFEKDESLSEIFCRRNLWSGADGIYSFNLERDEDYGQKDDKTLFVFGDTFVGTSLENKKRLEPTKMVNNSICYKKGKSYDFEVRRDDKGAFISTFSIEDKLTRYGYIESNLTLNLGKDIQLKPYLSSLCQKEDPKLYFDLHGSHKIKEIRIENFYDDSYGLKGSHKRGANKIKLSASNDGAKYQDIGEFVLEENVNGKINNIIILPGIEAHYVHFVLGRKNGMDGLDNAAGLNKVRFFDDFGELSDVTVTTNSLSAYENKKSWFWLQDGYRKDNELFIYPEIVEEELNGIEGFEFKIKGVCEAIIPINDYSLDLKNIKMREVPFYRLSNNCETILGSTILDNSKIDGYLYIYGYCNERDKFLRSLIAGRIKKEDIGDYNKLYFYDGVGFVRDIEKAKKLLGHVSTEMSVIPLKGGKFDGKYLAVFQYDSIGKYVCYSIGESPIGPFSNPRPVYETPELKQYTKTTYTYNAKAHLHLSDEDKILVSYNVNDMSMKANKDDYTIYHPRFGYLIRNDK